MNEPVQTFDFDRSDIKTSYCIDLDTRDRQVLENCRRIKARLEPMPDHGGHIAVVCYGPSLEQTWEQVKNFKHIITCSGAHKFMIDRGVIPTMHNEVDPREHKADLIGTPHKDVKYLVASVCHKKVLDLLEGFDVRLWHVFANEASRTKVAHCYAHGEWSLCGGSNVGMRSMVIARFLGFKKMTLFGMDYSFKVDGSQHAGWHPKEHPNMYAVQVNGDYYYTNPAMHQYAQQFFDEVQKLGDIQIDVVGNGLLQAQIREHVKTKPLISPSAEPAMIAAMLPNVITPQYSALNRQLHEQDPSYGISGSKRADAVRKLIEKTKPGTILDYGCGKGTLAAALPVPIWEYDPAIPGKDSPPRPADLVVCTDVLEHVEPECLDSVLIDLARCTLKVCYVLIHTGPAIKTLPDGRNTHLIQKGESWWNEKLSQFFKVASSNQNGVEFTAVLGPKPKSPLPMNAPPLDFSKRITPTRHNGTEVKFYTPNQQTHWRATSLFTKEPCTIEWIESFQPGEVFFDVGANMGGYSVWAAKRRGVKVVAFEPESGNYSLLCRNLVLNECDATAYCVALTNIGRVNQIGLSSQEMGGGCHAFGETKKINQGCIGMSLAMLCKDIGIKPDHIKIDVDGQEPDVILGALGILDSLKSILVEVNTNLVEHREMVQSLQRHGFEFDQAQVDKSIRKEGQFKGVAEYIFRRKKQECVIHLNCDPDLVRSRIPFPWFYREHVFPIPLYEEMIAKRPTEFKPISETRPVTGYPQRYTGQTTDPFWINLFNRMRDGQLKRKLCEIFGVPNPDELEDECLLIRDLSGYKIGPHTDSKRKVITALFYLPDDDSMIHAGTSIYTPKDSTFRCAGGPHYEFENFDKVETMPFLPNSAFFFLKTDNSFHGVEPCDGVRDILLYDIRKPK